MATIKKINSRTFKVSSSDGNILYASPVACDEEGRWHVWYEGKTICPARDQESAIRRAKRLVCSPGRLVPLYLKMFAAI